MKLNKLTALLLAGVLALGLLSGCGGNEQAPESAAPESAAPESTAPAERAPRTVTDMRGVTVQLPDEIRRVAILDKGFHKLALGHHYDDAVETFVMSLIFEGRISCFQPVTNLDRTGIIQIRPMLYIHEKTVDHFAQHMALPVLENRCPVDKHTKREEIKQLVYDLSKTYPDLKARIFGAMQRFPLPEWEPHGRYKPPKDEE